MIDALLGQNLRAALKSLFLLEERCPPPPITTATLVFGAAIDHLPTSPTERRIMASGKLGQYIPINPEFKAADGSPGQIDGQPVYAVADPALAEIVQDASGAHYVHLLAQGSVQVSVTADGDPTDGTAPIELAGLILSDDPADNAVTGELVFGPAVDALPEAAPAPEPAPEPTPDEPAPEPDPAP